MATYYVKNGGSDAASGLSDALAWETIAKVNGSSFSAGDSILFKKGCTWREQLTVPSSGSAGNPITFGAYGTGADPIISGANLVTSWTQRTVGVNLLTNPSFESGSGGGWGSWNGSAAQVTDNSPGSAGTKALEITAGDNQWCVNQDVSLTNGTTYAVNGWIKNGTSANASITILDPSYSGIFYSDYISSGAWTAISEGTFVAASTGTYHFMLTLFPGTAGHTARFDDLSLRAITNGAGNTWYKSLAIQPYIVAFDATLGARETDISSLNAAVEWAWTNESNRLWAYSTSAPDSAYTSPGVQAAARDHGIVVSDKSYVTVQNLQIENTNQNGVTYSGTGSSPTNGIFDTLMIKNTGHNGIRLGNYTSYYAPNNTTIKNCNISYWGRNASSEFKAIMQDKSDGNGGTSLLVQDNVITGDKTYANGVHIGLDGVFIATGTAIIERNRISGTGHGIVVRGTQSPYGSAGDFTIRYNKIGPTADDSLYLDGQGVGVVGNVYYNVMYGPAENALDAGGGTINFFNNVCYAHGMQAIQLSAYATVLNMKNNIIMAWSQDGTTTEAIYAVDDTYNPNVGSSTFSNNVYYKSGSDSIAYFKDYGSQNLAAWKVSSSQDAGSLNSDPLFTNAAGGDFTLQASSPCRDAGVDLGATYANALAPGSTWPTNVSTKDQRSQGPGWEIGAYVFGQPAGSLVLLRRHR
jgi:hypothetical protein